MILTLHDIGFSGDKVESYDFSGKTVVPFCTSASSGIGSSASDLEKLAGGT